MGDHADDALFSGLNQSWGWRRPRLFRPVRRKPTNQQIFARFAPAPTPCEACLAGAPDELCTCGEREEVCGNCELPLVSCSCNDPDPSTWLEDF